MRGRKGPPKRQRIMVGPPRGTGVAPSEHIMTALERAKPLPEFTAALDAEVLTSDVMDWCLPGEAKHDATAQARAWDELIAAAGARQGSRRGGALLYGLAAVLPELAAARARAAIRPDTYRPGWAATIAALRAETSWYGRAAERTGYGFLLAGYSYDGAEPHAVSMLIDHMYGDLAKHVFVTAGPDLETTRDRLAEFCTEFEEIDTATAHTHLAKAYTGEGHPNPSDEDAEALRALILRRVRTFRAD